MKEYNDFTKSKYIMLNEMLDIKKFTNSYKIMWFYAIYKEILNYNKDVSIKKLLSKMVAISYYPIIYGKLSFGKQDKLKDIVTYLHNNFNLDDFENEDYLCGYIMGSNDKILNQMIDKLAIYVPYRLIRPFYEDFIKEKEAKMSKKMTDFQINKYIQKLNEDKNDIDALYKINNNKKIIELNKSWIEYIIDNKTEILDLINDTLIAYLESKNPYDNEVEFKIYYKIATNK